MKSNSFGWDTLLSIAQSIVAKPELGAFFATASNDAPIFARTESAAPLLVRNYFLFDTPEVPKAVEPVLSETNYGFYWLEFVVLWVDYISTVYLAIDSFLNRVATFSVTL